MAAPQYRKIELQSPADFTYLYANAVALSRQKLDLNFPPLATDDDTPDPMRERVQQLVDEYIHETFSTAASSISINGIDSTSPQFPFPEAFTTQETVEYEPYDSELASRVTALYAQLESLTTNVAQLRRDAPRKAAKEYAAQLAQVIKEEEEGYEGLEIDKTEEAAQDSGNTEHAAKKAGEAMDVDGEGSAKTQGPTRRRRRDRPDPKWNLEIALGTDEEAERWKNGDMAEVYEDALRTLQRLQGEGDADGVVGTEGNALATTVGKAERAARAAEVVESM
ncbi:Kinetochore Mis14 [Penicillium argentinense]|uniref:Kinetochore Mis14 n=1 Tax=Penicillium argentinense TaxID=1131581 RepID=A0A9W9FPK0_9EURO|nr:Kinetochore Mis14 [Penicillium argentinense]KAJ5103990.1 Kinetochore Mis14 [Penicillium argentinense]